MLQTAARSSRLLVGRATSWLVVPVQAYAGAGLVASKAKRFLPAGRHRELFREEAAGASVVGEEVVLLSQWVDTRDEGRWLLVIGGKNKKGIRWNGWHGQRGAVTFKS
jgi:hypothetical protein